MKQSEREQERGERWKDKERQTNRQRVRQTDLNSIRKGEKVGERERQRCFVCLFV